MTPEQFSKLPKFVQEEITKLKRERQSAVDALKRFCDAETPSSIWTEDHVCDGVSRGPTTRVHYIQSRWLHINHADISMQILLRGDGGQNGHPVIDIQYGPADRTSGDIVCQPRSYQQFYFFNKEK